MAQALSEATFLWHTSSVWPPRTALPNSTSYELEGTVLKHYPLNIRKANEQQGYMKSSTAADVNVKHRALTIQLTSITNLKTSTSLPLTTDLSKLFSEYITLASGSANPAATLQQHLVQSNGTIVVWCEPTLVSSLSSKFDGAPIELTHALVRIRTEGETLIAKSVDLLKQASENKSAPKEKLSDQPNLFAQAASTYKAPVVAKPKKDDDEWDD